MAQMPVSPPQSGTGSRIYPDITRGSELRQVVSYGGPLAAGMVLHTIFNLADFWICAQLGPEAINAVGISDIIMMIPAVIANGICTAAIAVVARNYGLQKFDRASSATWHAFILMIILGAVTAAVGYFFGDAMLRTYLRNPLEMKWAHDYFMISAFGSVTMFLLLQVTSTLRSTGESVWPMVIFFMSTALNVLGNILLVFGYEPLGIPRMNVAGSATASVIARVIGVTVGMVVLLKGRQSDRITLRRHKLSASQMWQLIRIGLPSSAQLVSRVLAVYILASIVESVDHKARAGYIICTRLDMLAMFLCLGWGAGASTLVGQNLGAAQPDRAARSAWYTVGVGAVVMMIVAAAFITFAHPLVGFFAENTVPVDSFGSSQKAALYAETIGDGYLGRVALTYPFIAISIILATSLNGAGSTKIPFLFDTAVMLGLMVPAVYAVRAMGLPAVWWTIAAANVALTIPYIIWFRTGRWRTKHI